MARFSMLTAATLLAAGSVAGAAAAPSHPHVPPIHTRDIRSAWHTLPEASHRATVLVFIAHDCPVCNSYAPEISRLAAAYAGRGVAFNLVYAESGFSNAQASAHEKAYGYHLPAFTSAWKPLVRATGVTTTPEAVVLAPSGAVLYRGRIDDLYAGFGVRRSHATTADLAAALDDILDGKPVRTPQTKAIGCIISPTE